MAGVSVPLSIAQKQKVLYSAKVPAEELAAVGDQYAEMGHWHDALDFYEGAKDRGRLEKVAAQAVKDADVVLYLNARRVMGEAPAAGDLARLRENAMEQGKESVAGRVDFLVVPPKD